MPGDFLDDIMAMEARDMLRELRDAPMTVILMPAPDPRHEGHMIRVVISRPPDWYMDRFYRGRGRKTFKRHRFIAALKAMADGRRVKGNYFSELRAYVEQKVTGGAR